ncbi:MAG: hypothetical protein GWP91_14405 [Rhodobacterales bacterium]|nr:hypothetical protein [Rhodobacterales bacterium]
MILILLSVALAGTATLHVGVHRQAGGVYNIAADGATGLCVAGPARISCPAEGTVHFRWGGDAAWGLTGEVDVAAGEVGVAHVLAIESSRVAERELLATNVTRDVVHALFVAAPGLPALPPSEGMVHDLERLARHPDPHVRRAVIEGLVPFWRHMSTDPFIADAPEILEPGLITLLTSDADVRVRRRMAARLKELRALDPGQVAEVDAALSRLVSDVKPTVQKAALTSLKVATAQGVTAAEQSWNKSMARVPTPGAPGRAAANTLAFLAKETVSSDRVVPQEAVELVLLHHREKAWKVWFAWRGDVPFNRANVDILLRDTVALHRGLMRYWARVEPIALADAIRAWEPHAPHSGRWNVSRTWLADTDVRALRDALELVDKKAIIGDKPIETDASKTD